MRSAQPTVPVVSVVDVPYWRHDDRILLARVYYSQSIDSVSSTLLIHGGAWTGGSRLSNASIATYLASKGIVVASIDFCQPPTHVYPHSIAEINVATRWFEAHAEDFGGSSASLGIIGTSSGGHQALLAAMRPDDVRYSRFTLGESTRRTARIDYVVACWPICDPLARYHFARDTGRTDLVASHDAYWLSQEAMGEGSPQLILDRGEPLNLPPVLLLQGENDENVSPDMANRFARSYRRRGGTITLSMYSGMPHSFIREDSDHPSARAALRVMESFIRAQAVRL